MKRQIFLLKKISFVIGTLNGHPHSWDCFLKVVIENGTIVVENDYAGSTPLFYSFRAGLSLSNIEPCVYLAANTSYKDISYENLYGFLRYSHFIWDETAWAHVFQMLPDARYSFSADGTLLEEKYLATVKATTSRAAHTDKQVAQELFELNENLVKRSFS